MIRRKRDRRVWTCHLAKRRRLASAVDSQVALDVATSTRGCRHLSQKSRILSATARVWHRTWPQAWGPICARLMLTCNADRSVPARFVWLAVGSLYCEPSFPFPVEGVVSQCHRVGAVLAICTCSRALAKMPGMPGEESSISDPLGSRREHLNPGPRANTHPSCCGTTVRQQTRVPKYPMRIIPSQVLGSDSSWASFDAGYKQNEIIGQDWYHIFVEERGRKCRMDAYFVDLRRALGRFRVAGLFVSVRARAHVNLFLQLFNPSLR